jgi:hypothetical protein
MESNIYHFGRKLTAVNGGTFFREKSVNFFYTFWYYFIYFILLIFFSLLN